MSNLNSTKNVKEQYTDDKNLAARINLHAKHSTASISMTEWMFQQYGFTTPVRILELGCGNGAQWSGRIESLSDGSSLMLTDFSPGMVDTVWKKYGSYPQVLAARVDIQEIPFPDEAFDCVIANHMLYHVPDLSKALSEVKRVMKSNGTFFSSTTGNGGIRPYLHDALKRFNPKITAFHSELSFTLQNGEKTLREHFQNVRLVEYEDSLHITETQDLVDWVMSTITISTNYNASDLEGIYDYFEAVRVRQGGAIDIPKEAGMFISRK